MKKILSIALALTMILAMGVTAGVHPGAMGFRVREAEIVRVQIAPRPHILHRAPEDVLRPGIGKGQVLYPDHRRFPPRKMRYRKRGAPRKEVMAPMGSTMGCTTSRATVSLRRSRMDPVSAEAGSKNR